MWLGRVVPAQLRQVGRRSTWLIAVIPVCIARGAQKVSLEMSSWHDFTVFSLHRFLAKAVAAWGSRSIPIDSQSSFTCMRDAVWGIV